MVLTREIIEDFTQDYIKLPDLATYIENLRRLREYDFAGATLDDIGRRFYETAIMFLPTYGMQEPQNFNRVTFYRVRLNIHPPEDTSLIKTYSYPPSFACNENGRANAKGRSVFYCSNDPITAMQESRPKVGDIGYLSIWQPQADRVVKYNPCLLKDIPADNPWYEISSRVYGQANDFILNHPVQWQMHVAYLNQFIAEELIHGARPYYLSSWIANEMLYETPAGKDYILYGSNVAKSTSCNMAFHPNSVELLLRFEKVVRFKVIDTTPELRFSVGTIGQLDPVKIQWRQAALQELTEIFGEGYMSAESSGRQ